MKNLTWQNPEQLFVAQVLINKVKSKCCGIKDYNGDKFILWLKYKLLNETKGYGFEVRSFYKCIAECDLAKFDNCENDAGREVDGEV